MTVSNTPQPPVRNIPSPVNSAQKAKPGQPPRPQTAAQPAKSAAKKAAQKIGTIPLWSGLALSGLWCFGALLVVAQAGPARSFAGISLVDWAIGISAVVSPVALIWMVVAYIQRAADVSSIAEPLHRQLSMIVGESGAAEGRIRRFNQAIREQVELLRNAQTMSKGDFAAVIERLRHHHEGLEQFEQNTVAQVKEIQDIVRRNMQQIENLMDDKFTMLRILDDRLVQSGDTVARQTEAVRNHVSSILEEVETRAGQVVDALERSMKDSKKLADTAHAQESSLTAAATSAAETLDGLSGKIDLNIARFLERAGSAREEAERLAGALDAQTRSLDEFSSTMPVRVSEAEAVMRGVADRLYASEQLAREQAGLLTEKLSGQVEGLQQFLDRFNARITDIDGGLQQRKSDLDNVVTHMDSAAGNFTAAWEASMNALGARTNDAMARFTGLNEETRRSADQIAAQLAETTARYESSASRIGGLTEESRKTLKDMTAEIGDHLSQFEILRAASDKAGEEARERAAAAQANLQQVLERLLSARENTSAIGETLVRDLHNAVEQNEHLITRLNEAAQMSVRSLGIAAESLNRQEGESAERVRASSAMLQEAALQLQSQAQTAERGMRDQALGLMALLNEARSQMSATEQNLQGFAARALPPVQELVRQIDASAEQGLQSVTKYGEGVNEQLARLQQFHAQVGGMSADVARAAGESISSIESLNSRFAAARTAQEETARQTLQQFTDMSDRLQREVAGLDGQTARAIDTLQKTAAGIGEQSYQLLQNAENSGARMQMINASLQSEAAQIRAVLQKQADDLAADLSNTEKQFNTLGETLKQRTDAAYALLDRVATHYNETTSAASKDLDARTDRLEQAAGSAQSKAEALSAALTQQLNLINTGAVQLETQAGEITAASGKAAQQLSGLNEKIAFAHEAANNNARQTMARLDEVNAAFARQGNALNEAAQNAAALVQKSGTAFGEQTAKLQDGSQRIDQNLRQLSATAASVHEQTAQIRTAMEQQNQRLMTQLVDSVTQMTVTGTKLEQITATALQGADLAGTRFTDMAENVSSRLSMTSKELEEAAQRADASLSTYGTNITQQAASLAIVGDQLDSRYKTLSAANESQKTQLVELFDRLGGAHAQASDVAERTIVRLAESINQIQQQLGVLSDQSQTAVGNVKSASTGFADQTALLVQNAQAAEQQARTVLSVTAALKDQASQMQAQIQNDSQRTSEALAGLVSKLTSGGGELRDFGSAAEISLNSLNNAVTTQTRDLGSIITQLGERQRTLTTALDAQRDVLNGLLHRLTMAQDETAATAERTVSRLNEGSAQIGRQIEAMGSQAKDALSNVQNVNASLADEAGALGLHAQQAEQQMRGVLSVTAGLQEQTRVMREAMQTESARVVEQMNAAIAQLDMTTQMLKTQSSSVVHVMDQTVLHFAANAKTGSEIMIKQAEILSETARGAENRMGTAAEHVQKHMKALVGVGDQAEAQARQLADSAEYATGRLATLRDSFADADGESQKLMAEANARINESRTSLQAEIIKLAELSHDTVKNVVAAAGSLQGQSDEMRSHLAMSESALQQAADLIRQENAQLPSLLDRSMMKIEGSVKALKDQAKDSDSILVGVADRFIGVTTAARDNMSNEMRRIGQTAEQANTLLSDFAKALATQMEAFTSGTQILSTEQVNFVARASDSVAQLTAAGDRLAKLRNDSGETAQKLAEQFDAIDRRAASTNQRLSETSGAVVKTVDALTQAATRAESQMTGAAGQFREQLERIRAGMQGQIDDINRGLMQITAQLERTGTTLRTTTAGTVADVEHIAQRFDQTSKEAATQLTEKTARMRSSTEEVAKLLSGFGDQLDTLLDRLANAGNGIRQHEGDLIGKLQAALDQIGAIAGKLEEGRNLAINVSEVTVEKLSGVVSAIENDMQKLTAGSQTAAGIMRGIGQIYGDQTNTLNQGVREAHSQVLTMNKSIDDMQQRADRMRVSLKLQSDELMTSLHQILTQLASAGDTLNDTIDEGMRARAEEGLQKLG